MTGAECLLRTLADNGVRVCFMNPGTSEMHLVAALDRIPQLRGILCLQEAVCAGAADGYARMTGFPAAALLHLGPGLGNALSNLHNARKARSPVVALVGEHATTHLRHDAPLSSDIAAFARTVSRHIVTVPGVDAIGAAAAAVIAGALGPPSGVGTLIIPADFSWSPSNSPLPRVPAAVRPAPEPSRLEQALKVLASDARAGFILGGSALADHGALAAAGRIADARGARFFGDRTAPRNRSGREDFWVRRVPYFPEDAGLALAGLTHLFFVEAQVPVSFFGYANTPASPVPEGCALSTLAAPGEDGPAALKMLADELPGSELRPRVLYAPPAVAADGPLTVDALGRTLAALLPAETIISDEMISSREPVLAHLLHAAPHDQLPVTGGSIGQGLPVAVGAAVACPARKVCALEADGSAMYSLQALWTMARENLDVVTIVFANRRYRILDIEMRRTGAAAAGPKADAMLALDRPELDFVRLAQGMGVRATRAVTAGEFAAQLRLAFAHSGPCLIEAML